MTIPPLLGNLLRLLFAIAAPAAMCTMTLAGLSLREESGVSFEVGGRFQRWMLWSVILLTLPQFLAWFAAQGISMPPETFSGNEVWLTALETAFNNFASNVLIGKIVPVLAAFFIMKAALDCAQERNPLGSVICAIFLLSVPGTIELMKRWNSGTEFATADMLMSLWNYVGGTLLPEAAGLIVVAAIVNYSRSQPFLRLLFSALAFLSLTALWKLVQVMVG